MQTMDLNGTVQNNTEADSTSVDSYYSASDVAEDVTINVTQNNNINENASTYIDYTADVEFIRRNKFEVFTTLIGLLLAFLDWFSDIILGATYLINDEISKGVLTLGSVIICGLVSLVTFKSRRFQVRAFVYTQGIRWLMSIPSIQSIVLSILVAKVALFPNYYRRKERARFVDYKKALQSEANLFKKIETTLESAPQALLQLYIRIMELSSDRFSKKASLLSVFKINAALLSFFTIFLSIASVSNALRGAYLEQFDDKMPLILKLCLHLAAFMKYFLRITASILGYVLLVKGTQFIFATEQWSAIFVSFFIAFVIILLPRLVFLLFKSKLENQQLVNEQRPSKFEVILEGVLHFVVSLFTSNTFKVRTPPENCPDSIHRSRLKHAENLFKFFLGVEPVIHLLYWCLLTHFLSQSNETSQIVCFSAIILSCNAVHYLFKLYLLPKAVIIYNNCLNDWELVYNSENTLALLRSDGQICTICKNLDERIRHFVQCLRNYDQSPKSLSAIEDVMENINSEGHPLNINGVQGSENGGQVGNHVHATDVASLIDHSLDEHPLAENGRQGNHISNRVEETLPLNTHLPTPNSHNSSTENIVDSNKTKLLAFYNSLRNRFNIKIKFNSKEPDETHFDVELTKSRHIHFLLTYTTLRVVQWILINESQFSEQHLQTLVSLMNATGELIEYLRVRIIKGYDYSKFNPLPIGTYLKFFQYDEQIETVKKIFYVYHNNGIIFKEK